MRNLHDPSYRGELIQRVQALRSDSAGHWSKMSVDQMHHLTQFGV